MPHLTCTTAGAIRPMQVRSIGGPSPVPPMPMASAAQAVAAADATTAIRVKIRQRLKRAGFTLLSYTAGEHLACIADRDTAVSAVLRGFGVRQCTFLVVQPTGTAETA